MVLCLHRPRSHASWSVDMTWCWVCLQSTPQTQSANVTESSGEEEEEAEEQALAEDAGSEEAAGEGLEETAG